ncbi:MAG: hypothetical protein ACLTSZ_16365 [Lachnospiraceae bacterium]
MSNTEATTVKMPHIQLDASIHTTAAILPGDPARVDAIAAFLTDVREEGFNREYKSITGTYQRPSDSRHFHRDGRAIHRDLCRRAG